jgi:hypothetical protein
MVDLMMNDNNTDNIPALTLPPIAAAYDLLSGLETTIERNRKHIYTYFFTISTTSKKHYLHIDISLFILTTNYIIENYNEYDLVLDCIFT